MRTWALVMLAVVVGQAPAPVPARLVQPVAAHGSQPKSTTSGEVYELKDWKLQVSLLPEKPSFMPGEPIYLSFAIRNESAEDLQVIVGADGDSNGRPLKFTVQVIRDDGLVMPIRPSGGPGTGGMFGPQRIPANGSYSFSLFLPEWVDLKETHHYTITATRTIDISRYTRDPPPPDQKLGGWVAFPWMDPANVSHLDVQASAKVSVVPFDRKALGDVILARSRVMFGPDEAAARMAAKALAAIDDERAIEPLSRAVAESGNSVKFIAVAALARFNSDDALEALKRAAHDPNDNTRHVAAFALSKSPHPLAFDALVALRTDPFWGVRNSVLQALAKMQSAESLELIREMTKDADEHIRTEAQRYLALRTQAGADAQRAAATYHFTLAGRPVQGTLWLFDYSWYGLEKYKLDDIRDGAASVLLTPQVLAERVKPHPDVEAFIVAIDVPRTGWYRSRDMAPDSLFSELLPATDALGTVENQGGVRVVALAPPVRQTVQLVSPDGAPYAGVEIGIETFVYNRNHCAAHVGFDDGQSLRTDGMGRASFTAPLAPLYLPIRYYTSGTGPRGPTRTLNYGVELPAGPDHVVRVWMDAGPKETFVIHVRRPDGQPARGVSLVMRALSNECGANAGVLAQADGLGDIRASLAPAEVERLWLQSSDGPGGSVNRYLAEEELQALFKTHELAVTW